MGIQDRILECQHAIPREVRKLNFQGKFNPEIKLHQAVMLPTYPSTSL